MSRVATIAALLIGLILLALAIANPRPITVDVGAPGDAYALADFHRAERDPAGGDYRWSARGARLLIPAAADGPLTLRMRLRSPGAPAALTLERDGDQIAIATVDSQWRVYELLLPPDGRPEPATIGQEQLQLGASLTEPSPADPRRLGPGLDWLAVAEAPGQPALDAPSLRQAALLVWALALLTTLAPLGAWRLALAALGAGGLAVWAWAAPLGFAWFALTPPWWGLAIVTLAWATTRGRAPTWGRPYVGVATTRGRAPTWGRPYVGVALVGHGLLLAPPPWSGLGALLVLLLPGALAARALFPAERGLARLFLGLCMALATLAMLIMALLLWPGPPPLWLAVGLADGLAIAIGLGMWRGAQRAAPLQGGDGGGAQGGDGGAVRAGVDTGLLLLLLIGAGLRLAQLGAAEFQGDEARAMLLGVGVTQGDAGILLTHTKGPGEVLLPLATLLAGSGVEWIARLPFALAAIGVLLGAAALARALFGPRGDPNTAMVAVGLLAVDGFAIAFARIVQYQSLVMLMSAGAIWCCWRFYTGTDNPRRHLLAAAGLLAVGLLAHYDAALAAPALAWLTIAGALRRGWSAREWAAGLLPPALLGAGMLAGFYLPYVASPNFAETAEYLAGRAGQGDAGGPPFNNLPLYLDLLSFYNAPPLLPLLAGALIGGLAWLLWRNVRPRGLGAAGSIALLGTAAVQAAWPGTFSLPGGASWAGLAFGLPLALLCAGPGVPAGIRVAAIWFTTAFCAEAFLIADPRTHFYTVHIPAALLIAAALGDLLAGAPRRRALAGAAGALYLAGTLAYAQLAYLRQWPEYQRMFPAARPGLLRAGYGEQLPEAGYFGFPHTDGWKAAAELFRDGTLRGSYATNQKRWLAGWYMRDTLLCPERPDYFLIAEHEPSQAFPPGYYLVAEVRAGSARAMAIYGRSPPDGPIRSLDAASFASRFDARPAASFDVRAVLAGQGAPGCE